MIGIFDSGVGGLTVLSALRNKMPDADVVYFGDTKHAPYGNRSRDNIVGLTKEAFALLRREGATSIVSACNSVSVTLALPLGSERIVEMVGPTVRSLAGSEKRIGLCATVATIDSGIYQDAFRAAGKDIIAFAIPALAGAIEAGEDTDAIVTSAMKDKKGMFDLLILGCTHYPLARESFAKTLPDTELFDPALPVADQVASAWGNDEKGTGMTRFLISKDSPRFRALTAQLFPESVAPLEVIQ